MQDAINKTVIALGETGTTETLEAAKKKHAALVRFARAAGRDAHARVVQATLGHYHRDPHNDHLRDLAVTSIQAVLAAWDEGSDADRPRVKADADAVVTRLTTEHSIEWRAVRQKRLDDAAAAAGTDPVAGYEYVYASSIFPAVITGAANLPSPTWPFDGLRNGRVLRGSFFYYDGEPVPNRFQPWAIRFKRPVPENAVPGASIGSVPWEQETAYQPPIPEGD